MPPQDTSAHSDSWRVFAPGVSGVLRCGFTPQLISDTNCTIKSELKFKKLFQRAVLLLHVIWESHVTWELLRPPDYKPGMFRLFKQEWDPFTQHKIKPRRTGKDSNMIQKHKIIFKKNYQKTSSVHLKQTKCLKQDEHVSVMGIFYICYLMKTVSLSQDCWSSALLVSVGLAHSSTSYWSPCRWVINPAPAPASWSPLSSSPWLKMSPLRWIWLVSCVCFLGSEVSRLKIKLTQTVAKDQMDLSSDLEPAVTSSLLLTVTPVMKHSSVPFHCVCVCVGWWWGPYE